MGAHWLSWFKFAQLTDRPARYVGLPMLLSSHSKSRAGPTFRKANRLVHFGEVGERTGWVSYGGAKQNELGPGPLATWDSSKHPLGWFLDLETRGTLLVAVLGYVGVRYTRTTSTTVRLLSGSTGGHLSLDVWGASSGTGVRICGPMDRNGLSPKIELYPNGSDRPVPGEGSHGRRRQADRHEHRAAAGATGKGEPQKG
jgi:hypothetical protein